MDLHSSLTIFSQELTVFLGYNNLPLMTDLTDWYDCNTRWKYSTKNKDLSDEVINCWVNMFGATTPNLISSSMPSDAIGLGLTARIIFIYEQKKGKVCPLPFLTSEQIELRPKLIHDLERISMLCGKFVFTQDFLNSYSQWYIAQEGNPPFSDERLSGYIERRPAHLLKLTMIMSASRSDDMAITTIDFHRATRLLEATERKMPLVFGGVGKNPTAPILNRLMAILVEYGEITYEDILRRFSHDIDSYNLDKVIYVMEGMGFAKLFLEGSKKILRLTQKEE
jgi:hypothetical protein